MESQGMPTSSMLVIIIIIVVVLIILSGCLTLHQMKYRRRKRQYKLAKELNENLNQAQIVVVGGTDPVIGPEQGGEPGWNPPVGSSPPVVVNHTYLHLPVEKPKKKKWWSSSAVAAAFPSDDCHSADCHSADCH